MAMPLGTYLRIVSRIKKLAHDTKHKHDHDFDDFHNHVDITVKYNAKKAYRANFVNNLRE